MSCIMKFIKIQTNWVNWVKQLSHRLKKLEEGVNDTENNKIRKPGWTNSKKTETDCNCGF